MTKKFIILIHKYTDECTVVKSKTDLAEILGVSLSTVMRRYDGAERYESETYDIYMDSELYQTKRKMDYKRDVKPPVVSTLRHNKPNNVINMTKKDEEVIHFDTDGSGTINKGRHNNAINNVNMETNDEVLIHNNYGEYGEDVPEDLMDEYYSAMTIEELNMHKGYWKYHPKRVAIIDKYGEMKAVEHQQDNSDHHKMP